MKALAAKGLVRIVDEQRRNSRLGALISRLTFERLR
jgi:hypothetical protein